MRNVKKILQDSLIMSFSECRWRIFFLSSMMLCSSTIAQSPPFLLAVPDQQICNYQLAIPYDGKCVNYGPAIEDKLKAFERDMDRIKMLYVTQISIVEGQIQKVDSLVEDTAKHTAEMDRDLKNLGADVQYLQAAILEINQVARTLASPHYASTTAISEVPSKSSPFGIPTTAFTAGLQSASEPSASSTLGQSTIASRNATDPNDALLRTLVQTTRTQLIKNLTSLENRFDDILAKQQMENLVNKKTVAALRLELEQAKQESSSLRTDLTQLQKTVDSQQKELIRLQQMTSLPVVQPTTQRQTSSPTTLPTTTTRTTFTTTPPLNTLLNVGPTVGNGGVTNVLVQQLQSEVANLTSRVSQLEQQKGPVDLRELTQNLTFIRTKIENQSKELSSDTVAVDEMMNYRLPAAENDAKVIHDSLQNLNQTMQGVLQSLRLHNLTKIEQDIGRLGSNALDMKLNMTQDEKFVQNFNTEFSLLKLKVNKLANEIPHSTTQAPTTPRPTYAHMPTLPTKRVTT